MENLHFSSEFFHYVSCAWLKICLEMLMIQPVMIEIDKWLEIFVHNCQRTTKKSEDVQ